MEKRIEFSDITEAKAVLGMKDEFLKAVQHEFPACRIAARSSEIIINGEEQEVAYVLEVFSMLRYLNRENTFIMPQHVRYSAAMIRKGQGDVLQSIYSDTINVSARGKLIKPKTLGQKQYVDSIRQNLVTFGIGPAGTGKTYLAVALAAYYLKNREVERIVLTRPAVEAGEKLGFLPGDLQEKSILICGLFMMRSATCSVTTSSKSWWPAISSKWRRWLICAAVLWKNRSSSWMKRKILRGSR